MFSLLTIPGFAHARHYTSVTSTMDVARELIQRHPPDSSSWCAVLAAQQQTAGRGRQGRAWVSGTGSFMATYIFATEIPVSVLTGYSLAVGVAVTDVLESLGIQSQVKWPNDVVVVDDEGTVRKLGGVLIEIQEVDEYRCILVGLGLNTTPPPIEVSNIAMSTEQLGGGKISAMELVIPVGKALKQMHQRFVSEGGFKTFQSDWSHRSCFVANQSKIEIDLGEGQTSTGIFAGVHESGGLLLNVDGNHKVILSGHIVSSVIRPSS